MIALDPEEKREYVLKADRDKAEDDPNKSVFLLRFLKPSENAKLQDQYAEGKPTGKDGEPGGMAFKIGSHVLRSLYAGLRGWRNVRKADGTEIPWPFKNHVPAPGSDAWDDVLKYLPQTVRAELSEAIVEENQVGEDLEKNLPLPPSPSPAS